MNPIQCLLSVGSTCPFHPPPINGALACEDLMYGHMCQVYCNEKYDFARKPADWYICNINSQWETYPDNFAIPWPDCASEFNYYKFNVNQYQY